MAKKSNKIRNRSHKKLFLENYPDSVTELAYTNVYELLIAVMLSAQCTDKRVNLITPALFALYPTVYDLSKADINDIKSLINTCSFFNNKAKNLIKMAKQVVDNHDDKIPLTQKELVSLAGVGQKTANVVMLEYTGANIMAVDTHVFRVAHRLGLSDATTAIKTEAELTKKFKTDLHRLHQAMVLFRKISLQGYKSFVRRVFLKSYCKSKGRFKA